MANLAINEDFPQWHDKDVTENWPFGAEKAEAARKLQPILLLRPIQMDSVACVRK